MPQCSILAVWYELTKSRADAPAYCWFDNRGQIIYSQSYGEWGNHSRTLACAMRQAGLQKDQRVIILVAQNDCDVAKPDNDVYVSLFACWLLGCEAVLLPYPGQPNRINQIVRECAATAIIGPREFGTTLGDGDRQVLFFSTDIDSPIVEAINSTAPASRNNIFVSASNCSVVDTPKGTVEHKFSVAEQDDFVANRGDFAAISGQSKACLLYTSGSVAQPRGVELTHDNISAALAYWHRACPLTPGIPAVNWMPLYHNVGLILGSLYPLLSGCQLLALAPSAVAVRPFLWLETISSYGAQFSVGTNSMYAQAAATRPLCIPSSFDLSCWKYAVNGAEPVRTSTLDSFNQAWASWGFAPESWRASWGMSECVSLLVSGQPTRFGIDNAALGTGRVLPGQRILVGCGRYTGPGRLTIVAVDGAECPEDTVGEICLHDDAVAAGYYNAPAETERVFPERVLHSGDLGFLHDGVLYVSGRLKEIIKINGRMLYPLDIELSLETSVPEIQGCALTALAVEMDDRERLLIFWEGESATQNECDPTGQNLASLRCRIADTLWNEYGLSAEAICQVPRGSLPRTESGKVSRAQCRKLWLNGVFADNRVRNNNANRCVCNNGLLADADGNADIIDPAGKAANIATADFAVNFATADEPAPLAVDNILDLLRRWWSDHLAAEFSPAIRFSEAGLTSLSAGALVSYLNDTLSISLPLTALWSYTSPLQLAHHIADKYEDVNSTLASDDSPTTANCLQCNNTSYLSFATDAVRTNDRSPHTVNIYSSEPLAIVAVSCEFPGGVHTPQDFWNFLASGSSAVRPMSYRRYQMLWEPEFSFDDSDYRAAYLEGIERFDGDPFHIATAEIPSLDPQQRLLLKVAERAWKQGLFTREQLSGSRTGVFIGAPTESYRSLLSKHGFIDTWHSSGTMASALAGHIAYAFDLQGPALVVDTACSSSLSALHVAAQELRAGNCDTALVGGVNIILSRALFRHYGELNMLATDGITKSLQDDGDGYGRGEGCVVIALQRLSEAMRQNRPIWAVLRGTALNHGGHANGFTAPNGLTQVALLREVLSNSGLNADDIGYVETHGTGTPLGDPIEIGAWAQLCAARTAPDLTLGAVKANVGHLEGAAGLAGLLKTVLSLRERTLLPQPRFGKRTEKADWQHLRVSEKLEPWQGECLCAAVSSFGLTGSCAVAVLQDADSALSSVNERSDRGTTGTVPALSDMNERSGRGMTCTEIENNSSVTYRNMNGSLQLENISIPSVPLWCALSGLPEHFYDIEWQALPLPSEAELDSSSQAEQAITVTAADMADGDTASYWQDLSQRLMGAIDEDHPQGVYLLLDTSLSLPQREAVVALVRALRAEYPQLVWRIWHRSSGDDDNVVSWLRGAWADEDELRSLNGQVEAPRLRYRAIDVYGSAISAHPAEALIPCNHPTVATAETPPAFAEALTYIISGGTGDLGLVLANYLMERGARHLVLFSRKGVWPDNETAQPLRQCAQKIGADLQVRAIDVADGEAVEALVKDIQASAYPLGGVFHLAGAYRPRLLCDISDDDWREQWNAKALGALNLHRATANFKNIQFVVYASMATSLTAPGQGIYATANAFAEGVVLERIKEGGRGQILSWCTWSQIGLMARSAGRLERLRSDGVEQMSTAQALRLLDVALNSGRTRTILGEIKAASWLDYYPQWRGSSLWREMHETSANGASRSNVISSSAADMALQNTALAWRSTINNTQAVTRVGGDREAILAALAALTARVLGQRYDVGSLLAQPQRAFKDWGLDSLQAVELRSLIQREWNLALPITAVFEHPDLANLSAYVTARLDGTSFANSSESSAITPAESPNLASRSPQDVSFDVTATEPIAILGLGCRLPGAIEGPQAFWNALCSGRDLVAAPGSLRVAVRPAGASLRPGGYLERIDTFDADFFQLSAAEAASMAPQQRLLLETAQQALEDGGIDPQQTLGQRVGVFVGMSSNDYLELVHQQGEFTSWSGTGVQASAVAGRLAYTWGWSGPALVVDTACSSSLTAVHLACQSLHQGECDLALVAGVNLLISSTFDDLLEQLGALSPSGRCRTFSADADGFVRGEGCGVIVLQRLSAAREQGHTCHAVIGGSAVNQDGHTNGFSAPSFEAQVEVIDEAWKRAGWSKASSAYIEAHGTATPLGDPLELRALQASIGSARCGSIPLRVGTVKSNIGHLEGASGIIGLIKTALMVEHGIIVPSLHCTPLTSHCDWRGLTVPQSCESWPLEGVRRAGVSAFGLAGTNAHVALENAPADLEASGEHRPLRVFKRKPYWFTVNDTAPESNEATNVTAPVSCGAVDDTAPDIFRTVWHPLDTVESFGAVKRVLFIGGGDAAQRWVTEQQRRGQNFEWRASFNVEEFAEPNDAEDSSTSNNVEDNSALNNADDCFISNNVDRSRFVAELAAYSALVFWVGERPEDALEQVWPFWRRWCQLADTIPLQVLLVTAGAVTVAGVDDRKCSVRTANAVTNPRQGDRFADASADINISDRAAGVTVADDLVDLWQRSLQSGRQARLWGIARTFFFEHPDSAWRLVDLPDIDLTGDAGRCLLAELDCNNSERQVAWRVGQRYAPRLERATDIAVSRAPHSSSEAIILSSPNSESENSISYASGGDSRTGYVSDTDSQTGDVFGADSRTDCISSAQHWNSYISGAVLVSGASGALMREFLPALVKRGCRDLLLWTRHQTSADFLEFIDTLHRSGVAVQVVVAPTAELLWTQLTATGDDIRIGAIVHAAGSLDDGLLSNLTLDRFAPVLKAKSDLLENIPARVLAQRPRLLLFSALASEFGSAGQGAYAAANGYLDGLAARLSASGYPCLSLNWGPWTVGLGAGRNEQIRKRLANLGLRVMTPDRAIAALDALAERTGRFTVADIDAQRYVSWLPLGIAPFFACLNNTQASDAPVMPATSTAPGPISSAPATNNSIALTPSIAPTLSIVLESVREAASRLAGIDASAWDISRPFSDQGFDSLMAIELRNLLVQRWSLRLPATLAFDYPTVEQAASFVHRRIASASAVSVAPSVEPTERSGKSTEHCCESNERPSESIANCCKPNNYLSESVAESGESISPSDVSSTYSDVSSTPSGVSFTPSGEADFGDGIAIVGMACRLPGGVENPKQLWDLLWEHIDPLTDVPRSRWNVADHGPKSASPIASRQGGFLDNIDLFDGEFFSISPREAQTLDPQQRLVLENVWRALEYAQIPPERLRGTRTGVFMGLCTTDYGNLVRSAGVREPWAVTGIYGNALAGRVAYALGLEGPALVVDTACSSSLVATHIACRSLLNGECSTALVGGVNLVLDPATSVLMTSLQALSPTSRCRVFAQEADGYVRSEGCGVIVLKRFRDAQRDGNTILARICGSALGQDGRSNGFTAPRGPAQEDVMRRALAVAHLAPEQVGLIEAHGVGTPLSDPMELQSVQAVYGQRGQAGKVYVGAVKSNLGHTEAAAGVTALIKTVLCLRNASIPANLHCEHPTAMVDWDELGLALPLHNCDWPQAGAVRYAGVNGFGISGTNAHVLLEYDESYKIDLDCADNNFRRAPESLLPGSASLEFNNISEIDKNSTIRSSSSVLVLSAPNSASMRRNIERWLDVSSHWRDDCLPAAAQALAQRQRWQCTLAVSSSSWAQARAIWQTCIREGWLDKAPDELPVGVFLANAEPQAVPKLAMLFTGQGSQYAAMGRELYDSDAYFRRVFEHCASVARPYLPTDLQELVFAADGAYLKRADWAQLALFSLEYSLYRLWEHWGVRPQVVFGHSLGEFAAACVAGVFSLEDGIRLVAKRGQLMQSLPPGAMVAVWASEKKVLARFGERPLFIAAINSPLNCVVSGAQEEIDTFCAELEADKVHFTRLAVASAGHSPLLRPMLGEFRAVAESVRYSSPQMIFISGVTGKLADAEVASAEYWTNHLLATVRFATGMRTLGKEGYQCFLEIGPQPALAAMGAVCLLGGDNVFLPSMRQGASDCATLAQSWARLSVQNLTVGGPRFGEWRGEQIECPADMPGYVWNRRSYWYERALAPSIIDKAEISSSKDCNAASSTAIHLPNVGLEYPADMFLRLKWERVDLPQVDSGLNDIDCYPVALDDDEAGTIVPNSILGKRWLSVEQFASLWSDNDRPAAIVCWGGYKKSIDTDGNQCDCITSALSSGNKVSSAVIGASARAERLAANLLRMGQILAGTERPTRLLLVTQGSTAPLGSEAVRPDQSALWALGRSLAIEYPAWNTWRADISINCGTSNSSVSGAETSSASSSCDALFWSQLPRYWAAHWNALEAREDETCHTPYGIFAPRLSFAGTEVVASSRPPLDSHGTYVVSGGTGGLGSALVQWLLANGAGRVVVLSRRGGWGRYLSATAERYGERLISLAVDVADMVSLRASLTPYLASLRGVFHLAGKADLGLIVEQSADRLRAVMAPKAQGAWNLHLLTISIPLDYFVLYSSVGGTLVSPGQSTYAAANGFLDGLSSLRQSQGLAALSVNWSLFVDRGMGCDDGRDLSRLLASGIGPLTADQGLEALGRLMMSGVNQMAVLPLNVGRWIEYFPAWAGRSLIESLAPRATLAYGQERLQAWKVATAEERSRLVRVEVRRAAAKCLGFVDGEEIDERRLFSDMGLDSLMAVELRSELERVYQLPLPITLVFDRPTAVQVADYISARLEQSLSPKKATDLACKQTNLASESVEPACEPTGLANKPTGFVGKSTAVGGNVQATEASRDTNIPSSKAHAYGDAGSVLRAQDIAIVGWACHYPGDVDTTDDYWQLMLEGRDGVGELPPGRFDMDAWYDPDPRAVGKTYCRRGGFIDISDLDASFFGVSPLEAQSMDPHQALLLQTVWEALENAGQAPLEMAGSDTGVYVGLGNLDYSSFVADWKNIDSWTGTGLMPSIVAGRVSFIFGLTGPAVVIDTACSSSLVAVHLACQALKTGECTQALACGVNLVLSPYGFVFHARLGGLARDGRCKSFDSSADGLSRSDGCGVLVLKTVEQARRDGDQILAVLRGSAVNQDGRSNGLTAPSAAAQAAVMRKALDRAGVRPEEVGFVEGHGTGTPLGDPIELQALGEVYGRAVRRKPLWVGSIKSNIGHCEGASGIAALIKGALVLQHGVVPQNLHLQVPTPHVNWRELNLRVPVENVEMAESFVGVSNFGISGTNAHIIICRGE